MVQYAHVSMFGKKCSKALGQGDLQVILTDSAGIGLEFVTIFDQYKVNIVRDERTVKTNLNLSEARYQSKSINKRKARNLRKRLFKKMRPMYLSLEKACNKGNWGKASKVIERETRLLTVVQELPLDEQALLKSMLEDDNIRIFKSIGYKSWVRSNTAVFFGFDAKDQYWESDCLASLQADSEVIDREVNVDHAQPGPASLQACGGIRQISGKMCGHALMKCQKCHATGCDQADHIEDVCSNRQFINGCCKTCGEPRPEMA